MELVQNSAANGSTMGTYSMKQCRSAADMGMEDEQGGSMHKLARKEPFGYLKMGMNSAAAAGQNGNGVLFRANSLVGDGRMVCSPTNSCLSDSPVLIGPADMGDSRFLRTDSSGFGPSRNFSYHPQNYQYSSAGLMSREVANHMGMQGLMRSPFTANQWAELEHQALIFKYMMAGANVPPELLNPIRRSVALSGLITHPALRMGWGNFHLGMAANPDPEPGRCRRTDGKKWRCSKEVVPDQKYCDRHMHRGRNRAKKNAENQNAAAAAASGASNSNSSQISSSTTNPAITQGVKSAASLSASFGSKSYGGLSSDSTATNQYALPIPAASKDYRYMNRAEIFQDGNASHPAVDPWKVQGEAEKPNSILQYNSFRVPGQRAYDAIAIGRDCPVDEQPLRHFFDDWPRSTRDPPTLSWPDLDPKPDPPQLSISSSSLLNYASPPSPSRGKLTLSPLKLSMSRADDDPDADIGLGINLGFHHRPSQHHQQSWIPLEAASVGGPLGEVLHSGTNKGSSALTLLPDGWTEDSPKNNGSNLASPTAVLTKAPFGAFSDSSSNASSPRAETALLAAVAHRVKTQDQ